MKATIRWTRAGTRAGASARSLELGLWTIVAVGFVLAHLGDAPAATRDAGALAQAFAGVALFVLRPLAGGAVA